MFLLRFDLRIPPFVEGLTPAAQYGELLEMVRVTTIQNLSQKPTSRKGSLLSNFWSSKRK